MRLTLYYATNNKLRNGREESIRIHYESLQLNTQLH